MKLALVVVVMLAACAATKNEAAPADTEVTRAQCPIRPIAWAWADRDFDQGRSAALLKELVEAARADAAAAQTGVPVGGKLSELDRRVSGPAFVGRDVAELAVRLRQLDCAVAAGAFRRNPELIARRYQSIVGELEAARRKITG